MAITTVTFDLDDTLWPLRPTLDRAETLAYQWLLSHAPKLGEYYSLPDLIQRRLQLISSRPQLAHQTSSSRTVNVIEALMESGYDNKTAMHLEEQAFEVFIHARHDVEYFKYTELLLKKLHQSYKLGALTNGNADIARLDIGKYFDFYFNAEDLDASKPSPDHFLAALESSHAKPEQLVHIGDSAAHDIIGAQQVGCHAIWYNPQEKPWQYDAPEPVIATCLSVIPKLINTIDAQSRNYSMT